MCRQCLAQITDHTLRPMSKHSVLLQPLPFWPQSSPVPPPTPRGLKCPLHHFLPFSPLSFTTTCVATELQCPSPKLGIERTAKGNFFQAPDGILQMATAWPVSRHWSRLLGLAGSCCHGKGGSWVWTIGSVFQRDRKRS